MSPASHAPLWTRQNTNAFNESLSIDTSSVRDMQYMFQVRTAPAHTPFRLLARLPPSQHASLCTRQGAAAFNQPLTFDTSSVTTMKYMFSVRAASAHATHSPVGPMLHVT